MNEDQAVYDLFTAHGQFAVAVFAHLKRENLKSWAAVMHAIAEGGMVSVKTTTALSGMRHASVDIVLATGQALNLVHVEIDGDMSQTLN